MILYEIIFLFYFELNFFSMVMCLSYVDGFIMFFLVNESCVLEVFNIVFMIVKY